MGWKIAKAGDRLGPSDQLIMSCCNDSDNILCTERSTSYGLGAECQFNDYSDIHGGTSHGNTIQSRQSSVSAYCPNLTRITTCVAFGPSATVSSAACTRCTACIDTRSRLAIETEQTLSPQRTLRTQEPTSAGRRLSHPSLPREVVMLTSQRLKQLLFRRSQAITAIATNGMIPALR